VSEFTALRAVSLTLQALLDAEITQSSDPQIKGVQIHILSPKVVREKEKTGISVWLYRVQREPDTLNRPLERIAPAQLRHRPMPLTLHYLVCAIFEEPKDEQALLGKVVQVFHDHAILGGSMLKDSLMGEDHELRLVLEALTLEELARVWDSLNEPYQLSLSYAVQVVEIDSDRDIVQRPPVLTTSTLHHQILGEVEQP
jgi:uncharacterized protein DUF4255